MNVGACGEDKIFTDQIALFGKRGQNYFPWENGDVFQIFPNASSSIITKVSIGSHLFKT